MGMKLFEGSDGSDDDIQINKEFARRYEHNKRREGLQRLEELKKKGLVNDSSSNSGESSSDDDDYFQEVMKDLNNQKKNVKFFNALVKVKDQDPGFNTREFKLFESESESESESGSGSGGEETLKKEKKPKYLKDVVATHLMEIGPEFEDKDETKLPLGLKSYSQEQEELRKAVLDAAGEAFAGEEDDDGEFLRVKESGKSVEDEDGADIGKKADEFFGGDEKLDQDSMYLKNYFTKKMWVGKEDNNDAEGVAGFSEDEEEVERQEDYEREYNFRFEENAGDRVMGHSRFVEGSVRKKTSARQLQRKSKEERMALAEFERKEELKHLKNLKKKEMNEKLRKIKEIAGIKDERFCALDVDDLEEDFDPNEYDKKMKQAFNDEYYQADDVDPRYKSDNDDGDLEKPDFDKEDELFGLPKGWDKMYGSGDGFLATRERNLKRGVDDASSPEVVDREERASEECKSKKKRIKSSPEEEKLRQELLDEYYKLDYEDTVGDLKTRFKYKSVNPKRYGLSTEEVLLMDDMELNQYVSLKKLAPYRENEWKVPRIKTYSQKQRNKALLQGETTEGQKTDKKKFRSGLKSTRELVAVSDKKLQPSDTHVERSNLSRKSRRKHRQAELKLSRSRLLAYGKIPSKNKKKK